MALGLGRRRPARRCGTHRQGRAAEVLEEVVVVEIGAVGARGHGEKPHSGESFRERGVDAGATKLRGGALHVRPHRVVLLIGAGRERNRLVEQLHEIREEIAIITRIERAGGQKMDWSGGEKVDYIVSASIRAEARMLAANGEYLPAVPFETSDEFFVYRKDGEWRAMVAHGMPGIN